MIFSGNLRGPSSLHGRGFLKCNIQPPGGQMFLKINLPDDLCSVHVVKFSDHFYFLGGVYCTEMLSAHVRDLLHSGRT